MLAGKNNYGGKNFARKKMLAEKVFIQLNDNSQGLITEHKIGNVGQYSAHKYDSTYGA